MNFVPAGSFLWLLAHEIRLSVRGSFRANRIGIAITAAFILTLTAFAGVPLAIGLRHVGLRLTGGLVLGIDLVMVVLFTLLLSQTLSSATLALYERGDLDLLLSSPIPAYRVLAVRGLAIATQPLSIFLSLLCPLVVPPALFGHPAWLAAIGMLVALSLAAGAVGLLLAMGLFAIIGPRRTRTLGQLLAALIGAALFLVGQSRYMFSLKTQVLLSAFIGLAHSPAFRPESALAVPARAVLGEPVPFLFCAGFAVLLFVISVHVLGARFSKDASIAAGIPAERRRKADTPARRFHGGAMQSLVRKELLLLVRDPALLSQVFLRVLYLLPLVFILLRNVRTHAEGQIATGTGALVFIASQLAASLAWITISAEDAPDLLTAAPITKSFAQRAKLTAALLPLFALLILPILILAWFAPAIALAAGTGVLLASVAAGLINLWYESPGQRRQFRRRGSGSLVGNMAVLLVGSAWSVTATGAVLAAWWAPAALLVTGLLMLGFYRGRTMGRA